MRLTRGDIVVESEEGDGSVFKFSLALPTSGQRGDLQKLSFAMSRTPSGLGDERIRGIRVLLVDANPVRQVGLADLCIHCRSQMSGLWISETNLHCKKILPMSDFGNFGAFLTFRVSSTMVSL